MELTTATASAPSHSALRRDYIRSAAVGTSALQRARGEGFTSGDGLLLLTVSMEEMALFKPSFASCDAVAEVIAPVSAPRKSLSAYPMARHPGVRTWNEETLRPRAPPAELELASHADEPPQGRPSNCSKVRSMYDPDMLAPAYRVTPDSGRVCASRVLEPRGLSKHEVEEASSDVP